MHGEIAHLLQLVNLGAEERTVLRSQIGCLMGMVADREERIAELETQQKRCGEDVAWLLSLADTAPAIIESRLQRIEAVADAFLSAS